MSAGGWQRSSAEGTSPRAVLVGLPGTGKSTTGRRLAAKLHVVFADSDTVVEQRIGHSVAQAFTSDGEAAFRVIEADVIAGLLSSFDGVLALGGGAVLTESTRIALSRSEVPVVLLRSSVRTLRRRVGDGQGRPLLAGNVSQRLAALAADREPLYLEVATHVVNTDRRSSSRVAIEIAGLLGYDVKRGAVSS